MGSRASDVRSGLGGRRRVGSSSARGEVVPVIPCMGVKVGHPCGMNGERPGWGLWVAPWVGEVFYALLGVVRVLEL